MPTYLTPQHTRHQCLLDANILSLREGSELLDMLTAAQYKESCKPVFQSTIGTHFRHVLEHYRCFFGQIESGRFCYDDRERDPLLEQDLEYAASTISEVSAKLIDFDTNLFTHSFYIHDQLAGENVFTSLDRELLFLQSHTVHHYAIIAAMSRLLGEQPMCDFGVAIATRAYLCEKAQADLDAKVQADLDEKAQAASMQKTQSARSQQATADDVNADDCPIKEENNRCAQ